MLSLINNPAVQSTLSTGEYLSYARYGKYIPFAPAMITHPFLTWVGDSCRLTNATRQIHLSLCALPKANWNERIFILMKVAQQFLSISNTKYGYYVPSIVPKNACNSINLAYRAAKTGVASQELMACDTVDAKIEGVRMATLSTNYALCLAGYKCYSSPRLTLGLGYCALTVAKMLNSTANFFHNLIRF